MIQIIDGKLSYNETNANANGGTEIIARKMVNCIDSELIKNMTITKCSESIVIFEPVKTEDKNGTDC